MNTVSVVILFEWLITLVGVPVFLVFYGRPWKQQDKVISWHVWSWTTVAGLEIVGLLLAGWSLVPSAIAYGLATGILYWRLGLVLAARRRARRRRKEES